MLFSKAKDCGLTEGFEVGGGAEIITHLQFADDTIIFSSSRWEEIVVLKRILRCFELSFELRMNLSKCMLVGIGTSNDEVQLLASKLLCRVRSLPFPYSSLPVGGKVRYK